MRPQKRLASNSQFHRNARFALCGEPGVRVSLVLDIIDITDIPKEDL